jgi:hypothetical protein
MGDKVKAEEVVKGFFKSDQSFADEFRHLEASFADNIYSTKPLTVKESFL